MAAAARHRNFWNWMQHRLEQHPIAHLSGLFACCIVLFLITIPMPHADGQLIGSDGVYYYAYLPTLLLDHDLNFDNQYDKLLPERMSKSQWSSNPDMRPKSMQSARPSFGSRFS